MKYLRIPVMLILLMMATFAGFIIYSTFTWYDPPRQLVLDKNTNPDTIPCDSVLSVLSWNIGYAGLGDSMNFFYDGGKRVRDSYEQTVLNLDSISHFLKRQSKTPFVLLQEVDVHSRRSYYLNQKDTLAGLLSRPVAFAPNYVVGFVPVPPTEPMGKVNSGVLSMSRYQPESSTRYGYPGMFDWPNRLFNLRRCMLVNRYSTRNGKELVLINSHLSAFDDGSLKKQEMEFLRNFALDEYGQGNYVIVGGDWNQAPPNFPLTSFGENYQSESFILSNIAPDFMPACWMWIYDARWPTNRYLNEIYTRGKTFRCLIDFFLVSPNIDVVRSRTFNLDFRSSDHNPVYMEFSLQ
jgi:endonuclease/exonuclease/phosphatase family metal-dependent hydrolase